MCNSFPSTCFLGATLSRKADFFFAQWLIFVTALYLIIFPLSLAFVERNLIFATGFALFFVEVFYDEPLGIQIAFVILSLGMVVVFWIVNGGFPEEYDWYELLVGATLTGMSTVLFVSQSAWHLGYPWIHPIWHALAALGQYHILCVRDAAPALAALDSQILKYEGVKRVCSTRTV